MVDYDTLSDKIVEIRGLRNPPVAVTLIKDGMEIPPQYKLPEKSLSHCHGAPCLMRGCRSVASPTVLAPASRGNRPFAHSGRQCRRVRGDENRSECGELRAVTDETVSVGPVGGRAAPAVLR